MPPPPSLHLHVAAEALRLRSWALAWLAGEGAGAPAASPPAWEAFLSAEGCAAPLLERLVRRRAPVPDPLRAAALGETQRALAARRELRMLDALAAARGWHALVLKGGAAVAEGAVLDLRDVDLLVCPGEVHGWDAALRASGRAGLEGSRPRSRLRHHHPLGAHQEEHGVMVELHTSAGPFAGGAGADIGGAPLEDFSALRRMVPENQSWHVLTHAALQHPERRGRLRDVLLLARAVGELTVPEARRLRERAEAHPVAALARELEMAEDLAAGRKPADRFPRLAALRILFQLTGGGPRSPAFLAHSLRHGAVHACLAPAERLAYLRSRTGRAIGAPAVWGMRLVGLIAGAAWSAGAKRVVAKL